MFTGFIEWALRVVVASFILLLWSLLLWFIWDTLMRLFHGPILSFETIAVLAFLAAIAVGNWAFSLLPIRATTPV